jgi:hypothetical protein
MSYRFIYLVDYKGTKTLKKNFSSNILTCKKKNKETGWIFMVHLNEMFQIKDKYIPTYQHI